MKIKYGDHVKKAIKNNRPIVALETTIISHGMPYPKNIEVAKNVEKIIRENGAEPATIGIVNGEIVVGLSDEQIEEFGKRSDIVKCSIRDLGYVLSNKLCGSTTVAASIFIAKKANIDVFVTGGIGGVHRNFSDVLDVSCDLEELGKTSIITVCAGPKAILDVGKTLEYLETKGVPVVGYNTDSVPLFYTSRSNYKVLYNLKTSKDIAKMYSYSRDLGTNRALLVVNPLPKEDSIPLEEVEKYINEAMDETRKEGISGKEITPFLLKKINVLSSGKSQVANTKLIYNNALLGAKIALSLKKEE
ncbi:MAG: pseudouridine-5'-phosphate glycosidase [Bacilli bacterium]